jgi:hypothetical protein
MAKKNKGASSTNRSKPRERRERRFLPLPAGSSAVVYLLGAVGAIAMGGGAWEEIGPYLSDGGPDPLKYAAYVLAAGVALVGVAIWIGTSGDPPLRVGDGGIAVEKGGLRRMPWHAVESIELLDGAVRAAGKDDTGSSLTIVARLRVQAQAAAWILKEARERVPAVVHVSRDSSDAVVPEPLASAGASLALEPPQVVGQHCAASGKVIAYEPDARVCPRCERVYHKAHVPASCACGSSLEGLAALTDQPRRSSA